MNRTLEQKPGASGNSREPKTGTAGSHAPRIVDDVLASPGRPLDETSRAYFEPAFGHDFSRIRIHDDSRAASSADQVGARAYSAGDHIVLGDAVRSADSLNRRRTLAHELTHTVQQRGARIEAGALQLGQFDSPSESEARNTAAAVMSGRSANLRPAFGPPVLQRDPKPGDDKGAKPGDDDPTPWLTLQAQGLGQYQRIYTIPKPPPALVGGQLAANFQFHRGKKGFELALIGQRGHILKLESKATDGGDQWQGAIQPSYLFINTDAGTQVALFGQGGYADTSSKDPNVAGKQFSLIGGLQVTQDIVKLGPVKMQGVGSLAGGAAWAKGPLDDKYSAAGTWQVNVGIQFSLDAVKRKPPPPPPEHTEVPLPEPEPPKKADEPKKNPADELKKIEEQKKAADEAKKPDQPPPKPPLPADAKIFFLQDRPQDKLPSAEKDVIATDMGGEVPKALKTQVDAVLAADSSAKVALLGYASIEGPTPEYNCHLGANRAKWVMQQLGIPSSQVADPTDASYTAGSCSDDHGIVSFGDTKAAKTKVEAERKKDRYVIVHFHRK